MANRLQNEKSPYLLQHKDNPVDWYPWSAEAFEAAGHEDKPVFLSIGYSTCHWCHVMAHESFEDTEIAEILKDFICIKVDREERPDIDAVYMDVCQALTGSGGWPLTILMTPEQKPFFAGTYFPKKGRRGQPGLTELLKQAKSLWDHDRERLIDAGNQITEVLLKNKKYDSIDPEKSMLTEAYEFLRKNFDPDFGGFGDAPKFPTPHNLLFLLRYYRCEKKSNALRMVEKTLDAMAKGGIFDHIGGGFSRYSTDEKWLIPHFEKMLYDNALLIPAYLEAYQITKKECYAEVARRTGDYILRELTDPEGGFYCGQDADSDGEEGKYYTLAPNEIESVLGQEKGAEFCRLYGITDRGNFEEKSIPNRIGQKAEGWRMGSPEFEMLYEYRKQRVALHKDDKILLSWNAWTIIALARAGSILHDDRYSSAASAAQRFIEESMTDEHNRLFHRFRDGEAAHAGQLDDYAVYALALLELYRTTLDANYLKQAILRAGQMTDLFEDETNGGYFLGARDAERLIARPKELYDGAIPSGNSVAAVVLGHIASLTGDMLWQERSDRQLRFISGQIRDYPAGYSFSMLAVADSLYPHRELVCAGEKPPEELTEYFRKNPADDISVIFKSEENESLLAEIAPFTLNYPLPAQAVLYYLCENGTCRAPVDDFEKLPLGVNAN
ncbi:hypothetical protein SAMN05216343_10630 [Oscillibacter sp. PC13]|uniref:thioredoxin domain-containing protein n=1 Tax=Oscillibacter sp. PC13 TaxID=1855299 RepID=UPI0008E1CA07|nr:thioredoxin domain-containing protein [Oscillibacter sp. PC13]SFP32920.1 hypothetical protein SAMN05216343_10630 [Oscillibacter sp. PC13]